MDKRKIVSALRREIHHIQKEIDSIENKRKKKIKDYLHKKRDIIRRGGLGTTRLEQQIRGTNLSYNRKVKAKRKRIGEIKKKIEYWRFKGLP